MMLVAFEPDRSDQVPRKQTDCHIMNANTQQHTSYFDVFCLNQVSSTPYQGVLATLCIYIHCEVSQTLFIVKLVTCLSTLRPALSPFS